MTRGWQVLALALALAGACTRPNPAYEDGTDGDPTAGPGPTAPTGEADSSVETGPSETNVDTLTTLGTSATEADEGSTTSAVEGTSGETTATETGEGVGCMPEVPYDVTIDGSSPPGPCGGVGFSYVAPMGTANDGLLMGKVCPGAGDCSCLDDPQLLAFEGPLPSGGPLPADLSECFLLQVQLSEAPSCSVLAYAIIEIGGTVAVGSNIPNPMVQEPFDFTLGTLSEPCTDDCAGAGQYTLDSALDGGVEVLPDHMVHPVPFSGSTFEVINLGSGIMPPAPGLQCEEVVRWQAVRL